VKLLLSESKQALINIGYPEVVASLFYQKFGELGFIVGKWYKDFSVYHSPEDMKRLNINWWRYYHTSSGRKTDLNLLVEFYEAARKSLEDYNIVREKNDFRKLTLGEFDQTETLKLIKESLARNLFEKLFFTRPIIKGVLSGEIKDMKPYKDLSYKEANYAYETKKIFSEKTPIKTYRNGWRWINVGQTCDIVGHKMKNCGSTGVMSMDKDRTMITLFDPSQNPHVVATYSPNEKRLSGVEGIGSSEPKLEYSKYIIDLVKILKVEYDWDKSKSGYLSVFFRLRHLVKNFKEVYKDTYNNYFSFNFNGQPWFASKYHVATKEFVMSKKTSPKEKLPVTLQNAFGPYMRGVERQETDQVMSIFTFVKNNSPKPAISEQQQTVQFFQLLFTG
jgi:hypothetical protein